MRKYIVIQLEEIATFLTPMGFKNIVNLPNTGEVVFGRRIDWTTDPILPLSLRVYTAINLAGDQRDSTEDAIRVCLFARLPNNSTVMINSGPRVQRIETWRKNLMARIEEVRNVNHVCPICASPMRLVEPKKDAAKTFTPFYACVMWPITNCKGRKDA